MVVIPLFPDYKATVTTTGLSLAYKSQRKTMNRRLKKKDNETEERKNRGRGERKEEKIEGGRA